jgi:predicted nucleotidyltransferase
MSSLKNVSTDKLSHPAVNAFKEGYGPDFNQDFSEQRTDVQKSHVEIAIEKVVASEMSEKILELFEQTDDNFVKQSATCGHYIYPDFDVFVSASSNCLKVSSVVLASNDREAKQYGSKVNNAMQEVVERIAMINHKK